MRGSASTRVGSPACCWPSPPARLPALCAGMSDALRARLDTASAVFTWLFTAECLAKLLAVGAAGFLADGMNAFDAVVVLLSLVDTLATVSPNTPPPSPSPSPLLPCQT